MATITSSKQVTGNRIAVNAGDVKVREVKVRAVDIVNAGTYATDDLFSISIPVFAGEVATDVSAKLITAFAGSGNQLNLIGGDGTDPDGFLVSAALHTSQTEISYVLNTGAYFNDGTTDDVVNGKLYTSDDTIDFVFDGTAGTAIDLGDLTAGEVLLKVFYKDLN
jgi:hypothetical protein